MPEPFDPEKFLQKSWEMQFGLNVPRHEQHHEDRQISPMKEPAEADPRLAIEQCEQEKDRQRVNQSEQAFRQASQCATNPETEEPKITSASPLIATYAAKNRAGDERGEHWFGHDNAPEQRCAAAAKINQARKKSAPVISQFFAD